MNTQSLLGAIFCAQIFFLSSAFGQSACEDPDDFSQFTTECGTTFDLCIDRRETEPGKPIFIAVTTNDESIFDPCQITLPLEEERLPQNGSVIKLGMADNCQMKYTPDPTFTSGLDSFDYNFVTQETCNGRTPYICFDENGNERDVGKIWTMKVRYYGPDGLDLVVHAEKKSKVNGSTPVVGTINNLISGQTFVLDGSTLEKNTNWAFTFEDGECVDVHTSCSQPVLGVDFGYFMPISVCAAGGNAGETCDTDFSSVPSNGRALMEENGTIVEDFTRVFIMIQSLLPIDFSHILGYAHGATNVVEWGIASVTDEEQLILQKSTDGSFFEDLMFYDEINTGDFQYVDHSLTSSKTYYRLKSVSFSGTESFSEVLAITNRDMKTKQVSIFPVPTRSDLTITADAEISNVEILDLQGRRISNLIAQAGSNNLQVDLATHLAPGIYLSRIQMIDGSAVTKRIEVAR